MPEGANMKTEFTKMEIEALKALVPESSANGHDFGLLEAVVWPDRQQLGGLVTSLRQKRAITSLDETICDGKVWTQYVLSREAIERIEPHICSCCGEECPSGVNCCSDEFPEAGDIRETGR
jgi:hypothetical protein